jgi:hypothetical protein
MRRACALLVAALSFVVVAAPAGASPARSNLHSPKFVGTYRVHIGSSNIQRWKLRADGSWLSSAGPTGFWANRRAQITLDSHDNGYYFTFVGTRTRTGINSKRDPGPVDIDGGHAGRWYAVKTG